MPYLGAPFVAEGSADGLFEVIALIRSLEPRVLVHGHPPLTDIFTAEALPAIESALQELHQHVRTAMGEGRTLAAILHENILPASLREHPTAVAPYLVMRDNFVKRVYHQSTGYWKPDGEGMEVLAPAEYVALGAARQAAWALHGEEPGWRVGRDAVVEASDADREAARTVRDAYAAAAG